MVATGYVGHDPTLVPKTTQVIAGSGLSGGGPLSTDVTLVNTGGGGGGVPSGRLINTTAPLTGGGDLSADRTLAVSNATGGAVGVVQLAGDLAGTATAPTVPGLTGKQPLDATLTALAGLDATTGVLVETAADTFLKRVLAAGSNMVTITNPGGVAGNPTIDLAPANFSGIPENGVTNLVTDLANKQPIDATLTALAGLDAVLGMIVETAADTFVKRVLAAGSNMVTLTNPAGTAGNPTIDVVPGNFTGIPESGVSGLVTDLSNKQPLDAGLTSLAALASTGLVAGTAADTYTQRSIVAGSGKLVVTNGGGVAGNPSIDIGTLLAADIPNLDASKITTGVFSGNRLPDPIQVPNLISGAWYTVPGTGGTGTINPVNNTAICVCFVPLRDCTLSGLAVEITTQDSTGTIRFGLASDSSGVPGSWLNDFGTAVATSIAVVQPGSTPNVALTAGTRYYAAIVGQSLTSGLALRSRNSSDPNIASTLVSTATPPAPSAIRNCITSTGWSGALSGALGGLANSSGCAIIVRLT